MERRKNIFILKSAIKKADVFTYINIQQNNNIFRVGGCYAISQQYKLLGRKIEQIKQTHTHTMYMPIARLRTRVGIHQNQTKTLFKLNGIKSKFTNTLNISDAYVLYMYTKTRKTV